MTVNSNTQPVSLALVVPCYNEAEIIDNTVSVLLEKLKKLIAEGMVSDSSFLCLVDDGSQDSTWELIVERAKLEDRLRALKLASNVGHQKALLAGLEYSVDRSDATITLDADLQDDLGVLEEMLEKHISGAEIVFGVRSDRSSDSWLKRGAANFYYWLGSLLGLKNISNHADFRLMGSKAVDAVLAFPERNLYLRGICVSVGFDSAIVYYERQSRIGGSPKYSLSKMLSLGWDGITSFSVFPLRLISVLGVLIFFGALAMSVRIFYAHLFLDTTIPGWSSTVLPIFMLGGIQLLSLGVIGEYIAKIYIETKQRPRYLIDRVEGEEP